MSWPLRERSPKVTFFALFHFSGVLAEVEVGVEIVVVATVPTSSPSTKADVPLVEPGIEKH